jgi:hypothetical protein
VGAFVVGACVVGAAVVGVHGEILVAPITHWSWLHAQLVHGVHAVGPFDVPVHA